MWILLGGFNRNIYYEGQDVAMSASEILRVKIVLVFFIILVECILLLHIPLPPAATLDYETKAFADYMTLESPRPPAPFFDGEADDLDNNCKYPVFMHKDGHWVGIKDLLQCDRLDIRNCAMEARDIFLSYSLCRLLARRYYGFHCAEEGNAEVRQLTVTQLLHDYKRAFTIVDVQLAFFHDHFFTSYRTNTKSFFNPSSVKQAILWLLVPSIAFVVVPVLITHGGAYCLVFYAILGVVFGTLTLRPVVPKYWLPIRFAFLRYSTRELRGGHSDLHSFRGISNTCTTIVGS